MHRPSPEIVDCPSCRVKNFAIDEVCSTCHEPLTVVILPKPKVRHVGLATVMVAVAVLALCFALMHAWSPLGIAFSMIVVPAMLHTMLDYESRRAEHKWMTASEIGNRVLESISFSIILMPVATFFLMTISAPLIQTIPKFAPTNEEIEWMTQVAYGVGTMGGIAASFFLARRLWPTRD